MEGLTELGPRGVVDVSMEGRAHLSAELLALTAGVLPGSLRLLQAGPQLAGLLPGCCAGPLQDQQRLLLLFLGPLKPEQRPRLQLWHLPWLLCRPPSKPPPSKPPPHSSKFLPAVSQSPASLGSECPADLAPVCLQPFSPPLPSLSSSHTPRTSVQHQPGTSAVPLQGLQSWLGCPSHRGASWSPRPGPLASLCSLALGHVLLASWGLSCLLDGNSLRVGTGRC